MQRILVVFLVGIYLVAAGGKIYEMCASHWFIPVGSFQFWLYGGISLAEITLALLLLIPDKRPLGSAGSLILCCGFISYHAVALVWSEGRTACNCMGYFSRYGDHGAGAAAVLMLAASWLVYRASARAR